ncbi:hypothetical protein ACFYOF_16820 [Streptomyces sp. NPDC007148]
MTGSIEPGSYVIAGLVCWTLGWIFFLAAGITALATAIRNFRNARRSP